MRNDIKKPNRKVAFQLIDRLRQFHVLEANEIDQLLMYFAPSNSKKPKTAIEWVASAIDKKIPDKKITHLYSHEDGYVYATDRRICFRTLDHSFTPGGYYCPITFERIDDMVETQYLRVKEIFDIKTGVTPRTHKSDEAELIVQEDNTFLRYSNLKIQEDNTFLKDSCGLLFNKKYMNKATMGQNVDISIASSMLFGSHAFGDFVVMGVRDD